MTIEYPIAIDTLEGEELVEADGCSLELNRVVIHGILLLYQ